MIRLDTNVIHHFLFKTELTSASGRIIGKAFIESMAVPMVVYNELLYTAGAKITRTMYGVKGKYSF